MWWFIASAWAEPTTLTLLHVNDIYEIAPRKGWGGMAELMTLLEAERAKNPNAITTFGGDLFSPSVLSAFTKGEHMVTLMGDLGVDLAVVGNHEFDHGDEVAEARFQQSSFPWLGTNVLEGDTPAYGLEYAQVQVIDGLKVGFIGLLTPASGWLSSSDARIADAIEVAHEGVSDLQKQGIDVIVALTHMTIAEDLQLAREVEGIDVILGGHEHNPIAILEGETLVFKAGYDGRHLGIIDLVVDPKEGTMVPSWRLVANHNTTPHPGIAVKVAEFESWADAKLAVPVGRTKVMLDSRRHKVRTQETALGNFIADAMRTRTDADVALTNGGGIRGDRTYKKGQQLTARDVLAELPFGNVTVKLQVTGAVLLQALEHGVSAVEEKEGRFPHIAGMKITYDPKAGPGQRIQSVVFEGGELLGSGNTYTIATSDYLATGGDGYAMFKDAPRLIDASDGVLMSTAVIDAISSQKKIAPTIEGRITSE